MVARYQHLFDHILDTLDVRHARPAKAMAKHLDRLCSQQLRFLFVEVAGGSPCL